jgi:nucleotide-binding universal stress UspA family protein
MAVAAFEPASKSTSFHNILFATDFSPASACALRHAIALASLEHAHLFAMHVLGPQLDLPVPQDHDPEAIAAEQHMADFIAQQDPDHRIEATNICRGKPNEVIASLIVEKQIDLLIIGTHGRGGFAKLAVGSVAERLLRIAPCPVLTIGPHVATAQESAPAFQTILFATDFGQGSAAALPLAISLAKEHNAKLVLLHMMPPMPVTGTSLSAYAPTTAGADELIEWEASSHKISLQRLQGWLPKDALLSQPPDFIVGTELLPEGILLAARERKADLIVMGANHTFSAWTAAHLPWSLLHEVLCQATCPVLTVAG